MKLLQVTTRQEWRKWLRVNASKCDEIWLVYFKKNSGQARVSYEDAVLFRPDRATPPMSAELLKSLFSARNQKISFM